MTGSQSLSRPEVLGQVATQSRDVCRMLADALGAQPRLVWKPVLTAGGPHHTVLSTAVGRKALADFADMAGVELLFIDEATDTRSFAKELRWNNTYYRLAQRL